MDRDIYTIDEASFETLREMMYRESGVSLSDAKRPLVCSRLGRRLKALRLANYRDYIQYLKASNNKQEELQNLVNCLTTNKTDFFRERHHFHYLRDVVFPELENRARRSGSRSLRIWSSACSEGDEPYSIAMTVMEHLPNYKTWDIEILASDVNTQVLDTAQRGVYPIEKLSTLEESWKRKYLLRGNGNQQGKVMIRPDVKRLINFKNINLMKSWPIEDEFDVIFCRNVIIYFDQETQTKLLQRMAERLTPDGHLMLGHSENCHWLMKYFELKGNTIFKRRLGSKTPVAAPVSPEASMPKLPHKSSIRVSTKPKLEAPPSKPWIANSGSLPRHHLIAGQTRVLDSPGVITTILGSCVAVCLYDPEAKVGGMNHFMLPNKSDDSTASARYGVHAMELLITSLMKHGADRRRFQAKAFGGADLFGSVCKMSQVGRRNVEFIREFLQLEEFPLISEKLGGERPLRVHFQPHDGRVFVETLNNSNKLISTERQLVRKTQIESDTTGEVVLFT